MKAPLIAAALCAAALLVSCADSPSVSVSSVMEAETLTAPQTTAAPDISEYTCTDNELLRDTVWKTYTDRGNYDIPQLTFEGSDKVTYETADFTLEGTAAYPDSSSTVGVLEFGKCTYTFRLQPTSPRGIALTYVSGDDILPQKCLFLT